MLSRWLTDRGLRIWTLFLLIYFTNAMITESSSRTYSHLPSAGPYSAGAFTSPYGSTQLFTEGAWLNISWESTAFDSYNLYLIRGQAFNQPISLQINYYKSWYYWQVNGGDDLRLPFLFRIVKSNGTELAQTQGGFLSEQFWIKPAEGSGNTPTSSLTSTHLRSATAPPAAGGTSGVTPSNTSTSTKTGAAAGGLSTGAEIGIGVGVGVGAAALLLAGAFTLWRRHKKRQRAGTPTAGQQEAQQRSPRQPQMSYQQQQQQPPPSSRFGSDYASTGGASGSMAHEGAYQRWPSPGPQPSTAYAYELQPNSMRSPIEMPGNQFLEPQELRGDYYGPDGRKSPAPTPIQPWSGRLSSGQE